MDNPVTLLGANGQPLPPRKTLALSGGRDGPPYDAADLGGSRLGEWQPYLASVDGELNVYRDRIVSRVRDLVRNDGWASGAITRTLDNVVGANFRPISKPDYRALRHLTGLKTFDHVWAKECGHYLDARYRTWAMDPGKYADAARNQSIPQIIHLAFRHKLIDGDALAQIQWDEDRVEPGRASFATVVQLIDPDRLSNPQLQFDQQTLRGGVEVNKQGAAVAYHIRRAHQGDWFSAADSLHWDRIPRETSWGRRVIVHDYELQRAGQHRGGAGILTPVLQRLRMLVKYDGNELDASIINAIFSAYIESPHDPQMVQEALGGGENLGAYQDQRCQFHNDRRLSLGENRIPILFPGEKITSVNASRPNSNFRDFENAVLRNVASGAGISAQQVSNDWSDVNYSSARAALNEFWKTATRRRHDFAFGFAGGIREPFIEEVFSYEDVPLPKGAPEYIEARAAYSRCTWIGPGRGWIDPVAERQGAVLGMDAGLSTLEYENAENSGEDWEETLDQRAQEIQAFKERNIPVPTWAGMQNASQVSKKPDAI